MTGDAAWLAKRKVVLLVWVQLPICFPSGRVLMGQHSTVPSSSCQMRMQGVRANSHLMARISIHDCVFWQFLEPQINLGLGKGKKLLIHAV